MPRMWGWVSAPMKSLGLACDLGMVLGEGFFFRQVCGCRSGKICFCVDRCGSGSDREMGRSFNERACPVRMLLCVMAVAYCAQRRRRHMVSLGGTLSRRIGN